MSLKLYCYTFRVTHYVPYIVPSHVLMFLHLVKPIAHIDQTYLLYSSLRFNSIQTLLILSYKIPLYLKCIHIRRNQK